MTTLYSLASGSLPSAIAILRLSGPDCRNLSQRICMTRLSEYNRVYLTSFIDPSDGCLIDKGMAVLFEEGKSFTGEESLEIYCHGGKAVVKAFFSVFDQFDYLRPAEPGEFTRQAFENGRIDLTEAEGINDLIHADNYWTYRQALLQEQGGLRDLYEGWRKEIIELRSYFEAYLDFSSEEDVSDRYPVQVLDRLNHLIEKIKVHLDDGGIGQKIRDGIPIVIAGPPNAGKSSLLNYFANRDLAIVTPIAGTTRDFIEVSLDIRGYPVILIDTAGIRESEDLIEKEGIRRSIKRMDQADLILWINDITNPRSCPLENQDNVWMVYNKIDLFDDFQIDSGSNYISIEENKNLDQLVAKLAHYLEKKFGERDSALISRQRYRLALMEAIDYLERIKGEQNDYPEIDAESLKLAGDVIGRITGLIHVEDVLDSIFSSFCIGK